MTRALRSSDRRYATVLEKMGYARSDLRADTTPAKMTKKVAQPKQRTKATKDESDIKVPTNEPDPGDDAGRLELDSAREEYMLKFGKRPFMGWDITTVREKIAAAEAGSKKSSDGD